MSDNHQQILTLNKSGKGADMPGDRPTLNVLDLFSGIRPVASALDSNEPGCEPSPSAKSIHIAEPFLESIGLISGYLMMSENSVSSPCMESELSSHDVLENPRKELTLFAEDSPARTSVPQAKVPGLTASAAAYGQSTPALLAKFDRASSSWKTSQLCLDGELTAFSETFPRSGMTLSGTLYRLPTLALRTSGRGSGLWPTPTVNGNYNRKGASKTSGDGLATAVKLWPTPTARDWRSDSGKKSNAEQYGKRGMPLPRVAGGMLNPKWVEWLMGYPLGWTVCAAWVTRSSRRSRKSSGGRSSKPKE